MTLTLPAPRPRAALPSARVVTGATDAKAGPLGPGAGPLMTEWNLGNVLGATLGQHGSERMAKAMQLGMDVDWIRAAERAIRDALVRCEWHLEDEDGETIDGEYQGKGAPYAIQAWELLNDPQGELTLEEVGRRQTRRQQLTLTSRHLGLAGNAAWFLDAIDQVGIPHAILYVRPDRLEPVCDKAGVLKGWLLDSRPGVPGTPVGLDELVLLQYEPPDKGVFGPGLVESALTKALNSNLIDKHFQTLLASGGRISGVLAPREGAITDDNVYDQLVRDWRNITEQPDSARRLQIVRAPVDFTSTVQTAADMALVELMDRYRDNLLALWGVPLTMLNGQNAGSTGLNGGDARAYDEAVLWQSAVASRIEEIREAYQSAILDRYEAVLGWAPKLCYDAPSYDDETPAYDRAQKAQGLPLRNSERRAILGLDPFGDPSLDNAILLPINMAVLTMAPDEDTGKIPPMESPDAPIEDEPEQLPPGPMPQLPPGGAAPGQALPPGTPPKGTPIGAMPAAMQTQAAKLQGKAADLGQLRAKASGIPATVDGKRVLGTGTKRLRQELDARLVPKVQDSVAAALARQGDAVAAAVEKHWDAIVQHQGRDETQWWREGDAVDRALKPAIGTMASQVEDHLREVLGA